MTVYSYACREFPGMGNCPGRFETATEDELWQVLEVHAKVAHQENPAQWSPDERNQIKGLIRTRES